MENPEIELSESLVTPVGEIISKALYDNMEQAEILLEARKNSVSAKRELDEKGFIKGGFAALGQDVYEKYIAKYKEDNNLDDQWQPINK